MSTDPTTTPLLGETRTEDHRIFLHYLNPELLSLYGIARTLSPETLYHIVIHITKYACLVSSGPLIFPASYLFEVPYIDRFLYATRTLQAAGLLEIASPTPDLADYVAKKTWEYRDQPTLFPAYGREDKSKLPRNLINFRWAPRILRSSSGDISGRWLSELENEDGFWSLALRESESLALPSRVEDLIAKIPERLDGRAFILRYAAPLLPISLTSQRLTHLNLIINEAYLRSYLDELDAVVLVDTTLGMLDCGLISSGVARTYTISYREVRRLLAALSLQGRIERLSWTNLVKLRDHPLFRWLIRLIIQDQNDPTRPFETALLISGVLVEEKIFNPKVHVSSDISDILELLFDIHKTISLIVDVEVGQIDSKLTSRKLGISERNHENMVRRQLHMFDKDDVLEIPPLSIEERKTKMSESVDFGILTIREDEFEAVLQRFPNRRTLNKGRFYEIARLETARSRMVTIAITRVISQGNGPAQAATRDLISDLRPKFILLVGICGGVPSDDYTLGDVLLGTGIEDLRVKALLANQKVEYSTAGTPAHLSIRDFAAHLPALRDQLGSWSSPESIGVARPSVSLSSDRFYGSTAWKHKVRESLKKHFGGEMRKAPLITAGPLATSDDLWKDADAAENVLGFARHTRAFEMEAAGVFEASIQRDHWYPVLAIRGVSDIIGFKREAGWTLYACHSAASFAVAIISSDLLFASV